jgi:tetratricopeptide (TPR) repeat protein
VDEAEKLMREFRQRFPNSTSNATSPANFLYQRGKLDSMELVLKNLMKSDDPILKVNGASGMANYSLLRGRIEDTYRYGRDAQRIAQTLGAPPRIPLNDSLSDSWVDLIFFNDTAKAARRIEQTLAHTDLRKLPYDQRQYATLSSFFAATGNTSRARSYLAQLESEAPDSTILRARQPEVHAIRGLIAQAEGKYPEAIRELWRADTTYDGPDGNCQICVLDDIGWAWNAAGVADSAIFYWEKYLHTPYYGRQNMDGIQRPLILKRLGDLYELKGNSVKAAENYREFVSLWQNADPRLQPKVAEVRRRLSRLADVERR